LLLFSAINILEKPSKTSKERLSTFDEEPSGAKAKIE
jgi:hypothetical protein